MDGSFTFLATLVRVVLWRQGGSIGLPDMLLVVLLSECVSPSLDGSTKSVPNGLSALSVLLFWNFTLDRLTIRWRCFARLLEPGPVVLVRCGRPDQAALDRERISADELAAQLRTNGVERVQDVKLTTLEAEGDISVVKADAPPPEVSVQEATARGNRR